MTRVSPSEITTNKQITLPFHLLFQLEKAFLATAYKAFQNMANLGAFLKTICALKHPNNSTEECKTYYDQNLPTINNKVGDIS